MGRRRRIGPAIVWPDTREYSCPDKTSRIERWMAPEIKLLSSSSKLKFEPMTDARLKPGLLQVPASFFDRERLVQPFRQLLLPGRIEFVPVSNPVTRAFE